MIAQHHQPAGQVQAAQVVGQPGQVVMQQQPGPQQRVPMQPQGQAQYASYVDSSYQHQDQMGYQPQPAGQRGELIGSPVSQHQQQQRQFSNQNNYYEPQQANPLNINSQQQPQVPPQSQQQIPFGAGGNQPPLRQQQMGSRARLPPLQRAPPQYQHQQQQPMMQQQQPVRHHNQPQPQVRQLPPQQQPAPQYVQQKQQLQAQLAPAQTHHHHNQNNHHQQPVVGSGNYAPQQQTFEMVDQYGNPTGGSPPATLLQQQLNGPPGPMARPQRISTVQTTSPPAGAVHHHHPTAEQQAPPPSARCYPPAGGMPQPIPQANGHMIPAPQPKRQRQFVDSNHELVLEHQFETQVMHHQQAPVRAGGQLSRVGGPPAGYQPQRHIYPAGAPQQQPQQQQHRVPPLVEHHPNQNLNQNPNQNHHQMHPSQAAPSHLLGNPTPPLTPNSQPQVGARNQQQQRWQANEHVQYAPANGQAAAPLRPAPPAARNQMLKTNLGAAHHAHPPHHQPQFVAQAHGPQHQIIGPNRSQQQQQPQQQPHQLSQSPTGGNLLVGPQPTVRLTLPLCDPPLMGPFRLDHDVQLTSKAFHLGAQLYETLSKSLQANPHTATVIQELQFRAYLVKSAPGAAGQPVGPQGNHHSASGDSLLAANQSQPTNARSCQWPDMFQLTVNQQLVALQRTKGAHKAADIFQFCQPGENVLEIQVNDCYCSHEFVLEAVDRPTLKAFMNSCFKSRMLQVEPAIQKMKFNFGAPGYLVQSDHHSHIYNEYISEFHNGTELTKTRISLKCPISLKRMRTPTRGHNCKHLQCFDLENFLFSNRERSHWQCPLCALPIAFNMLELDQHQLSICQSLAEQRSQTDDVLIDSNGQWQAYFAPPPSHQQVSMPNTGSQQQPTVASPMQQQHTAKSTGTFHPQAPTLVGGAGSSNHLAPQTQHHHHPHMQPVGPPQSPMRPMSGSSPHVISHRPQYLDSNEPTPQQQQQHMMSSPGQPVRRPASAITSGNGSPQSQASGRRSASNVSAPQRDSPLAKKPYAGAYANSAPFVASHEVGSQPLNEQQSTGALSPLAAIERTIFEHEQQMGPPPFVDPSNLTASPVRQQQVSLISPNGPPPPPPQQQQQQQHQRVSPEPQMAGNRLSQNNIATAYSPAAGSPAATRLVAASPQHLPQSPLTQPQQQPQAQPQGHNNSTPATPSSMQPHHGPEAPTTPGQIASQPQPPPQQQHQQQQQQQPPPQQQPQQQQVSLVHSPMRQQSAVGGVDHQPLSNGSASAGSITSSSTMTPSGQSLGSVGMGGDSRCGTAPLQNCNSIGLDDLMLAGGSGSSSNGILGAQSVHSPYKMHGTPSSSMSGGGGGHNHLNQQRQLDDKSEILMNKLMMDSGDSLLHRNNDLALALEEADWKQQLDRDGKSEHLANFLNEPRLNKKPSHHHMSHHNSSNGEIMLSGGLNPSDDESRASASPSGNQNLDHLSEFTSYLDADDVDNGAGLPPDDSILDLFER